MNYDPNKAIRQALMVARRQAAYGGQQGYSGYAQINNPTMSFMPDENENDFIDTNNGRPISGGDLFGGSGGNDPGTPGPPGAPSTGNFGRDVASFAEATAPAMAGAAIGAAMGGPAGAIGGLVGATMAQGLAEATGLSAPATSPPGGFASVAGNIAQTQMGMTPTSNPVDAVTAAVTGPQAPADQEDSDQGSAQSNAANANAADNANSMSEASTTDAAGPSEGPGAGSPGPGGDGPGGDFARGGNVKGGMDPRSLPGIHLKTDHRFADGGGVQPEEEEGFDAYHGSPHEFERFDSSKIGTGEGAQAFGYGHYLAENEGVARSYRDKLTNLGEDIKLGNYEYDPATLRSYINDPKELDKDIKLVKAQLEKTKKLFQNRPDGEVHINSAQRYVDHYENLKRIPMDQWPEIPQGHMYQVRVKAKPEHFLDWDAPLSEQHPDVRQKLKKLGFKQEEKLAAYDDALLAALHDQVPQELPEQPRNLTGREIYNNLVNDLHLNRQPAKPYKQSHVDIASKLQKVGIPGIKYFDRDSRDEGKGTRNYVIFDPDMIQVKRRYADGGQIMPQRDLDSDPAVQQALDITRQAQPTAPQIARQVQPQATLAMQSKPIETEDHPAWIPTRLITSKKAVTTPGQKDIVDLESMRQTPKLYQQNVDLVRAYSNIPASMADASHDDMAEHFVNHVKDNLLALHDAVPEEIRNRSRLWYDGCRNIVDRWSEKYNLPDHSVAASLAALSPQKDWYQNVSLAERVLEAMRGQNGDFHQNFVFDDGMRNKFANITAFQKPEYQRLLGILDGKTLANLGELPADEDTKAAAKALWIRLHDETYNDRGHKIVTPEGDFGNFVKNQKGENAGTGWGSLNEIGKAIRSIEAAENPALISSLMGEKHKVRNFYNNILAPRSPHGDVTIDTHAVAAGLYRPLSGNSLEVAHNFANYAGKGMPSAAGSALTGIQGTYPLYAEAYRRAAGERGILPREMQSITWEAVRGLFPDTFKTAANNKKVDAVWNRYKNAEISQQDARGLINEITGGIRNPSWFVQGGAGPNEIGQPSDEPRDISGIGVRRPTAEGIERRGGGKPTAPISARSRGSRPSPQIEEAASGGSIVDRALRLTSTNRPMVALADLFQRQLRGRPPS